MAHIIINIPNYYNGNSEQNNIVRTLVIYTEYLSGIGSIEEQICEYILNLPEQERTIAETDSKWNIVLRSLSSRLSDNTFDITFN